jgi:hypothetical protein
VVITSGTEGSTSSFEFYPDPVNNSADIKIRFSDRSATYRAYCNGDPISLVV